MTHFRRLMLEELERRNYAQATTCVYLQTVEGFAHYFKRPPDSSALSTSVSVGRVCSVRGNSPLTLSHNGWRCASSSSRRLSKLGAWPIHPIPRRRNTFLAY